MTDRPAPPTADDVRTMLRAVIDPELGANIVDLGMAGEVIVTPHGVVTIGIKLTIKGCPLRAQIKNDIESRVETHPGVTKVTIDWGEMTASERSEVVGVLDADIWGFSMPRMLGMAERLEARRIDGHDKPRIIPNERRIGAGLLKVVSTGMLVDDESTALMWRGLMLTKAVEQFLNDVH
ncbi:MAG: DUF59 domain-containing protein, partial [Actinobacteria bacterium]|nr:DUF59 domain-containing protein [Actinomycetota bacterium]